MNEITCEFCGKYNDPNGKPLDLNNDWHRIQGWERHAGIRTSGKHGGSDITLREPIPGLAHDWCIQMRRNGVNPNQQTLPDPNQPELPLPDRHQTNEIPY